MKYKIDVVHPSVDAWTRGAYLLAYSAWGNTNSCVCWHGSKDADFSATQRWCYCTKCFAVAVTDSATISLQWHYELLVSDHRLGFPASILRISLKKTTEITPNFAAEVKVYNTIHFQWKGQMGYKQLPIQSEAGRPGTTMSGDDVIWVAFVQWKSERGFNKNWD